MSAPNSSPPAQKGNPLHGITLQKLLETLVDLHGWDELARQVPIRCFMNEPSITSSLRFLRKTPWAREKVESFYLFSLRQQRRPPRR